MALFLATEGSTKQLKKQDFHNEKELQTFIEQNMENLFGIRFLASEFTTSKQHGGRIDTLALDENNSPVIIEYKWGEKDNIINQGLFYLDWLVDHTGDFQLLVQNKLNKNIKVDFGFPRILLIAQTFNKYDQYAINRMAENIELWGYSRYEHNIFELKLIASSQATTTKSELKQISKVNYDEYSIEEHLQNKSTEIKQLFYALQEKIFTLESEQKIEENPRKLYIAYRTNKNFAYIHIQTKTIKIHLPLKKEEFDDPKNILVELAKGVQLRGTYCEAALNSLDDLEDVIKLIDQSYLQSV
jgi:predicted transport protein